MTAHFAMGMIANFMAANVAVGGILAFFNLKPFGINIRAAHRNLGGLISLLTKANLIVGSFIYEGGIYKN